MSSLLFESFRTIGIVCDDVPFALNQLGKETFVTVSIGSGFMVYNIDKLVVRLVSRPVVHSSITSLTSGGKDVTFCASGSSIYMFKRSKVHKKVLDGGYGTIYSVISFGKSVLATTATSFLAIDGSQVSEFKLGKKSVVFAPSCMTHPHTYLNKVLVGSAQGPLELWNIRSKKCVYRFEGFGSAVLCIEQTPAVDVVAVGLADGRIVLHNIRLDATLMHFKHSSGSVTSISFRTDAGRSTASSFSMMVSGSSTGEIAIWDLDEKRMVSCVRDAHDGSVTKLQFVPSEPILISAGVDNSLKVFIFDNEDGSARLLRCRQGHKEPPSRIRYFGGDSVSTLGSGADASCCQILSAGRDRAFRVFHTARDQQNRELSQGPLAKKSRVLDIKVEQIKLPAIVDFACAEARKKDWCNVLSAHAGESGVFTWQLEKRVIGKQVLRPDGGDTGLNLKKLNTDRVSLKAGKFPAALCVAISICGNFGLVGSADGSIHKYNMQSGISRGSFPPSNDNKRVKRRKMDPSSVELLMVDFEKQALPQVAVTDKHSGPINGVAVDSLNSTVVSASYDGTVRFWGFVSQRLEKVVELGSPVSQMVINRDAGIFAVACDDFSVHVFDLSARNVIRRFKGHRARITDMAFSNDARWLATASADTSMRVWDLPTARCVDWLQFPTAVTGLSFSPTGEFLATSFADSVGISLWANKSYFGVAVADVIATKPKFMKVPAPIKGNSASFVDNSNEEDDNVTSDEDASEEDEETITDSFIPSASSEGLVGFSGTPSSKWYTLAHLELIKERNKPIEPPKKPEQAPFFLPSTKSVNPVFKTPVTIEAPVLNGTGEWIDDDEEEDSTENEPESRINKTAGFARHRTELFRFLELSHAEFAANLKANLFADVVDYLNSLSPSAIDFELRSCTLGPEDDDGCHLLGLLFDWLSYELQMKKNFELVQAIISRIIELHSDTIVARVELDTMLQSVLEYHKQSWKHLQGLIHHNLYNHKVRVDSNFEWIFEDKKKRYMVVTEDREYHLADLTNGDELTKAMELAALHPNASSGKVIRFLRARKGNIKAASEMLGTHLEWHRKSTTFEMTDEIVNEVKKSKYAFHKSDSEGRPVVLCRVSLMGKHTYDSLDIVEKAMITLAEHMDKVLGPLEKIVVLFSRLNHKKENTDLDWIKMSGSLFNTHYPERLEKAIVAPVNLFFRGIWNVAQYFFDADTRSKVILAPDVKTFKDHVAEENLSLELGGSDKDPISVDDLVPSNYVK